MSLRSLTGCFEQLVTSKSIRWTWSLGSLSRQPLTHQGSHFLSRQRLCSWGTWARRLQIYARTQEKLSFHWSESEGRL